MARQIELPMSVPICAWCRPGELGAAIGEVSHGICPRHLRQLKLELLGLAGARPTRPRRAAAKPVPNLAPQFI